MVNCNCFFGDSVMVNCDCLFGDSVMVNCDCLFGDSVKARGVRTRTIHQNEKTYCSLFSVTWFKF